MQVVQNTESLKRISFLAHSLGGLFARYAVAVLYSPNTLNSSKSNDVANPTTPKLQTAYSSKRGLIAGLEPINFITLATPHLGVRGRKQVCPEGYNLSTLFCQFARANLFNNRPRLLSGLVTFFILCMSLVAYTN